MRGTVFVFGDYVDTDVMAPGGVLHLDIDSIKEHAMEAIKPGFFKQVRSGDLILAGKSFGIGSSREQAPAVLKSMGISLILAKSFARIFFRNAINIGLQIGIVGENLNFTDGQEVTYSIEDRYIIDPKTNEKYTFKLPEKLPMEIISRGGIINYMAGEFRRS